MIKNGVKFNVHVDSGDVTGKTWDGDFWAKECLSFQDRINIGRLKLEKLGPNWKQAQEEEVALATILSELQVRLVGAPEWWGDGSQHFDEELLMKVFNGAKEVESKHIQEIVKKGEEAKAKLREIRDDESKS